jgi:hypothetical protein
MRTLLLRSVIFALLTIPFIAARDPNPVRGLKKALALFIAFNALYMLALRFIYPHLS